MSQEAKMAALKELATILKDKGTPHEELLALSGLGLPLRLKDVEHAIVALRKAFSADAKRRVAAEEGAVASAAGVTVYELREQEKEARRRRAASRATMEESLRARDTMARQRGARSGVTFKVFRTPDKKPRARGIVKTVRADRRRSVGRDEKLRVHAFAQIDVGACV